MSLYAEVFVFNLNNLVILLPIGLYIRADNSQCGMNLTQLLLGANAEINTLAVLDVVVNSRLE